MPWLVPVIVGTITYFFYPITGRTFIWVPLLSIYEFTLLIFVFFYHERRGGVFTREKFAPTLILKGNREWLQYLLVYGPFLYNIPLFILRYALNPDISLQMYVILAVASAINGFMEEVYWRACLNVAGEKAGASQKLRLLYAPIVFAFWHTAFVIHIYPLGGNWWVFWVIILVQTWTSGISWFWVLQKSNRIVPQIIYHCCANFLSVFPLLLVDFLGCYF